MRSISGKYTTSVFVFFFLSFLLSVSVISMLSWDIVAKQNENFRRKITRRDVSFLSYLYENDTDRLILCSRLMNRMTCGSCNARVSMLCKSNRVGAMNDCVPKIIIMPDIKFKS